MRVLDVQVLRRLLEWPLAPMRKVIVLAREHNEHELADELTVARDRWVKASASWLDRLEARAAARKVVA